MYVQFVSFFKELLVLLSGNLCLVLLQVGLTITLTTLGRFDDINVVMKKPNTKTSKYVLNDHDSSFPSHLSELLVQ